MQRSEVNRDHKVMYIYVTAENNMETEKAAGTLTLRAVAPFLLIGTHKF